MFGSDNWDVFELRSQLGIVSSDLHHRFVFGNNEGRVMAEAAVLSGFFATQGILRYGVVTAEMRRRAAEALERMGVAHLARRRLDEMSSGEARRVLLARALVTAPRALVLDEPTTGLDLVARHAFMERVRQIARDGTTLILITHHIEEIVPEIERVILLRGGQIIASGSKRVGADRAAPQPAVRRADRVDEDRATTTRARDETGGYGGIGLTRSNGATDDARTTARGDLKAVVSAGDAGPPARRLDSASVKRR